MSNEKITFKGITKDAVDALKKFMSDWNITPTVQAPAAVTPANPAPVAKFGEATLEDGTVIKWDGDQPLAVGTPVMVIDPTNPEGFLPMADGDYKINDGTTFTIKDGVVSVVTPAAAPATPEMPMNAAPATQVSTAQFEAIEKELSEVKEKFNAVTKDKEELETKLTAEIEALKNSFNALNEKSKSAFEMFVNALETPQENPVETPSPTKISKKEKLMNSNLFNKQ